MPMEYGEIFLLLDMMRKPLGFPGAILRHTSDLSVNPILEGVSLLTFPLLASHPCE